MPKKVIIYQVLTRLYGNRNTTRKPGGSLSDNGCGKMDYFTPTVLKHLREQGVTHVWYTGVLRHATQTDYTAYGIPRQHPAVVKGKAGSPYAIADYYDVAPDLANNVEKRMDEFERLVRRTHRAGLKVIIDFVPNHVARQYHSIAKPKGVEDLGEGDNTSHGFDPQNNFYYCPGQPFAPHLDLYQGEPLPYEEMPAKATGNDHFDNAPGMNDWYETVKLNYGVDYYAGRVGHFTPVPSTWQKMVDILLFWAAKGIDGVRCDMAEMVPAEFWAYATARVRQQYPDMLFIGEVYNPAEYRRYIASGFDYLYDKVGMYDTLFAVIRHERGTGAITSAWQATDDIAQHMLYFLENHDELRIASDFFAGDGGKAVPALIVSLLMQRNPFMLYAGQEYGERGMDQEGFSGLDGRTTIFDYWAIDTLCRASQGRLTDAEAKLHATYLSVLKASQEKAVADGLTFDLTYVNSQWQRQYAFLRKAGRDTLLVVANFDDVPVDMPVTVPAHAFDHLRLKAGLREATDLLTGDTAQLDLRPDAAVELTLPARGGVVYKFKD